MPVFDNLVVAYFLVTLYIDAQYYN